MNNKMSAAPSPQTLSKIAIAMGAYVLLVIWPCFDALRLFIAEDNRAFSLHHLAVAAGSALAVTIFSQRVMLSLCRPPVVKAVHFSEGEVR